MSFIQPDTVSKWPTRYGLPRDWEHGQPATERDFGITRASQKHGRRHDITLYIKHDGLSAVIAKPFYPPNFYRAPSGGLEPGESLEDGAKRKALEETALPIEIVRFLLRTKVDFGSPQLVDIEWHTHVFSATTTQCHIAPTDHDEIREARWAHPSEFSVFGASMRASEHGGLHYRAALHRKAAQAHELVLTRRAIT